MESLYTEHYENVDPPYTLAGKGYIPMHPTQLLSIRKNLKALVVAFTQNNTSITDMKNTFDMEYRNHSTDEYPWMQIPELKNPTVQKWAELRAGVEEMQKAMPSYNAKYMHEFTVLMIALFKYNNIVHMYGPRKQ
jgi:hypothetical protein